MKIDKPNYELAENKAVELLKKNKIEEPVVPIFDIANAEGIKLKFVKMPEKLQNVAGFFDPESKTIFINETDAPNRQTFTIAHELGHYILEHKPNEYGVLLRIPNLIEINSKEKEANCFAANLLVPSEMLKEKIKRYNNIKPDAILLAEIFGVSEEVMRHRLSWVIK